MSLSLIPWAAKQPFGNPVAKAVFIHLLIFNGRRGIIPSLARLAERTEFKERALRNAIRWLEKEGWIRTTASVGRANSYEILRGPSDGELHEALADTPAFNAGVTPGAEPPPRHEMPETPALNAAESLKESLREESPPQRAHAREGGGGRTHPRTGRKLALPIAEDWQPSKGNRAYVRETCPELEPVFEIEARKFRRYYLRNQHKADTDWCRRFEEWLDKAASEFRKANPRDPIPFQEAGRKPVRQPAASAAERSEQRAAAARELLAEFARDDVLLEPHPKANGRAGS
jgi:hypothetical protein